MPAPEGAGSGANSGLYGSLRSFWSVLLAILYTRLDLVSAELEDGGKYLLRLVIVTLAALLGASISVFFALFFLVVTFWDERVLLLGVISGACIVATAVLIIAARNLMQNRPKFLSQTIAELRRDVEGLRQAMAAKKDEGKP